MFQMMLKSLGIIDFCNKEVLESLDKKCFDTVGMKVRWIKSKEKWGQMNWKHSKYGLFRGILLQKG